MEESCGEEEKMTKRKSNAAVLPSATSLSMAIKENPEQYLNDVREKIKKYACTGGHSFSEDTPPKTVNLRQQALLPVVAPIEQPDEQKSARAPDEAAVPATGEDDEEWEWFE